eukprot:TRINITY_DN6149_c1_g3_i1.p1 TRINITY_DN6149_c1_g3~~TRINITY_DN6149_c1_g3_i1.p1  ORF type:complete len:770 (-),score=109.51 TRINITY_DN6149_c1_g3_i1:121-2430(-)
MKIFFASLFLCWSEGTCAKYPHDESIAGTRADGHLKRASDKFSKNGFKSSDEACRFIEAAVDIQPDNAAINESAVRLGCVKKGQKFQDRLQEPYIQISGGGGVRKSDLPDSCGVPEGVKIHDMFESPLGFTHMSEMGLKDWKKVLETTHDYSINLYRRLEKEFIEEDPTTTPDISKVNWAMFAEERTPTTPLIQEGARKICAAYLRKLGFSISPEEVDDLYVENWAAVYPNNTKMDETHPWHTHESALVAMVLFLANPEPLNPTTFGDPRGKRPRTAVETGTDGEPPFHHHATFFGKPGDIVIYPGFMAHRTYISSTIGDRLVQPMNCGGSSKKFASMERPYDALVHPHDALKMSLSTGQRPEALPVYWTYIKEALEDLGADYVTEDFPSDILESIEKLTANKGKVWFEDYDVQRSRVPQNFRGLFHNDINFAVRAILEVRGDSISADELVALGKVLMTVRVFFHGKGDRFYQHESLMLDSQENEIMVLWYRALTLDPTLLDGIESFLENLDLEAFTAQAIKRDEEDGKKMTTISRLVADFIKVFREKSEPGPDLREELQFFGEMKDRHDCEVLGHEGVNPAIQLRAMFSTRVYTFIPGKETSDVNRILEVASQIIGQNQIHLSSTTVDHGVWIRNTNATLRAVICDSAAEVWFADPRASWEANVHIGPKIGVAEPMAPFHRHRLLKCSAGEVMLFPAWFAYQLPNAHSKTTFRSFVITLSPELGMTSWRLPQPQVYCYNNQAASEQKDLEKQKRCEELKARSNLKTEL